jgi:hypothetical protein
METSSQENISQELPKITKPRAPVEFPAKLVQTNLPPTLYYLNNRAKPSSLSRNVDMRRKSKQNYKQPHSLWEGEGAGRDSYVPQSSSNRNSMSQAFIPPLIQDFQSKSRLIVTTGKDSLQNSRRAFASHRKQNSEGVSLPSIKFSPKLSDKISNSALEKNIEKSVFDKLQSGISVEEMFVEQGHEITMLKNKIIEAQIKASDLKYQKSLKAFGASGRSTRGRLSKSIDKSTREKEINAINLKVSIELSRRTNERLRQGIAKNRKGIPLSLLELSVPELEFILESESRANAEAIDKEIADFKRNVEELAKIRAMAGSISSPTSSLAINSARVIPKISLEMKAEKKKVVISKEVIEGMKAKNTTLSTKKIERLQNYQDVNDNERSECRSCSFS